MSQNNVIELKKPEPFVDDPITEIIRQGARKLLAQALEAEIELFINRFADLSDELGRFHKGRMQQLLEILGEERVQINFEEIGVVVGVPENCPLFNASFRDIGTLHAIKGKFTVTGFVEYTIPNGDEVYGTVKGKGDMAQGGTTGEVEFVGGTGTCNGITGTLEYEPGAQVKSAKEGTYQGITVDRLKYEGIKGNLTFDGYYVTPYNKETKGDSVINTKGTFTLPK